MIGSALSLLGGAAQASEEPYAKVHGWAITAEPGLKRCFMERFYVAKSGTTEGLSIVFDAKEDQAMLFWSTTSNLFPLAEGNLNLELRFRDGASIDDSWGSQTFHYKKVAKSHIFTLAFLDRASSRRIRADLTKHAEIGLFLGPVLQTAFPLAPAVVQKLTECAGRPL
jgi:hypothetical protein